MAKVINESRTVFKNIIKTIDDGKSLDELKSDLDILRQKALTMPTVKRPLGVDSRTISFQD